MEKNIYFIADTYTYNKNPYPMGIYLTHDDTVEAIIREEEEIFTTSIIDMNFDLIDKGYNIYLCRGNQSIQIKPHMEEIEKDIRKEHNLVRLFLGNVFNEAFQKLSGLDNKIPEE